MSQPRPPMPGEGLLVTGAWLHQLRNAVNSACLAMDVARRSLESGEMELAREFLQHAETSCGRSRDLLTLKRPESQADTDAIEPREP